MGASWVDHPSWELVDAASELVGRNVGALLIDADLEVLTRTANAQLTTFIMSLVVLDAAERLGLEPAACAGHSLGEYSALVAAGSLDFDDGVRLVVERGDAMQAAADSAAGTMRVVLGLDDDDVEAACLRAEGEVWVANFNAPGQVVIAGAPDSVERAGEIAKSLGAKRVLSFPVGGAFHTPLMAPARERLRKAIGEATFRAPEPFVVANVDARAHTDPTEWPGLLSAQLCGPVRWRQSLDTLYAAGMRTFVELGPGGVLAGLVKRSLLAEEVSATSVATPDELESLVELLAGMTAADRVAPEGPTGFGRVTMTERLIVSPATGPFRPRPEFASAAPKLLTGRDEEPAVTGATALSVVVGELVGWAGETEVRSPFAGSLEGIIVLEGERVVTGQPVAWLRVESAS
jgi:[acyl-carrier-protein] S-malonyltransferase